MAQAELTDSEDVDEDATLVGHLFGQLEGVTCRGHGVLFMCSGTEDAVTDAEVLDVRPGFYDLADHGIAVFERAFGEAHSAVEPFAVLVDGDVAVDADLRARADGGDVERGTSRPSGGHSGMSTSSKLACLGPVTTSRFNGCLRCGGPAGI